MLLTFHLVSRVFGEIESYWVDQGQIMKGTVGLLGGLDFYSMSDGSP